MWAQTKAPQIAVAYWRLPVSSSVCDVMSCNVHVPPANNYRGQSSQITVLHHVSCISIHITKCIFTGMYYMYVM